MWDFIKQMAGAALEQAGNYMGHAAFIEQLLNQTSYEAATQLLYQRLSTFEQADFDTFQNTLGFTFNQAQAQLTQARQNPGGESWGGSFEDQMAQFMAESQAGYYSGNSPAVQQAEKRVNDLQLAAQISQQMWVEIQNQKSTAQVHNSPPVEQSVGVSDTPSASRRMEAFQRHLRNIEALGGTSSAATGNLAATTEGEEMSEIDAMKHSLSLDQQLSMAMMKVMPGSATEELVEQLDDLADAYDELLDVLDDSWSILDRPGLKSKIGQCCYFAGMACESLRDDEEALEYYQQALQVFVEADNHAEVEKTKAKLAELRLIVEDDPDQQVEQLQAQLLDSSLQGMARAEALINLGQTVLRTGDSYAAQEALHEAETVLQEAGIDNPAATDMAQVLLESMQSLKSGEIQAGDTPIERSVKVRGLYQQLYMALSSAYRDDDLEKADHYLKLAEEMDSTSASQDFGKQAIDLLQGQFKDLLK